MAQADACIVDQRYWKNFLEGDRHAFSVLFKKYYNSLFQYAYRQSQDEEVAHECVQQLFFQLWNSRATISEAHNVKAYLFKALRSTLYKEKKYHHRFQQLEKVNTREMCFSQEDLLLEEEADELRKKKMSQVLNGLPRRQREVIYLKYYEELSYQQIAQVLDMNYQSVVNLIHRAIQKLREEDELRSLVLLSLLLSLALINYLLNI